MLAASLVAPAAAAPQRSIFTLAGVGPATGEFPEGGFRGDGGLATLARMNTPTGVGEEVGGGLLVADSGNGRIRKVGVDGTIRTIAREPLDTPVAMARRANGELLVADVNAHRVWVVSASGSIRPFAGRGTAGFSGDGGAAETAELQNPSSVIERADGSVLIADTGNQRVRQVDAAGTIRTIAGTGRFGFAGDHGSAVRASLAAPTGLALRPGNAILIADSQNHRIREVSPSGMIRTVAGGRVAGFAGDGRPATSARLNRPLAVDATADGGFVIADSLNNRIRQVSRSGRIRTVAGRSVVGGHGGDGRSPLLARLRTPSGVLETSAHELAIADADNNVVRYVPRGRAARLLVAAAGREYRRRGHWELRVRLVSTRSCYVTLAVVDAKGRVVARRVLRAGAGAMRLTIGGLRRPGVILRVAARGRGSVRAGVTAPLQIS